MIRKSIKSFFQISSIAIFLFGIFYVVNGQFITLEQSPSGKKADFFIDWSAKTFVPADYQGKPLPTFNSIINVSATPMPAANQKINENDYIYNWIIDGSNTLQSKNNQAEFYVGQGAGGNHEMQLRIFDHNKNLINEYFFFIPISKADILLYKETGHGTLDGITGAITVKPGSEISLIAEPFFFNNISSENDLTYFWKLDNKDINKNSDSQNKVSIAFPSEIPLKTSYELNLRVENPADKFQSFQKTYTILVQ